MSLTLENVTRVVGQTAHISNVSLTLTRGSLNVLLGPTLSGKTSLMRLMAGLDVPTSGRVLVDGKDVTGKHVRDRSVAMVYQQFINYPAWTVRENIASPLRAMGMDAIAIAREVSRVAELLRLGPFLERNPLELSGGQQQRVAIARALVLNPDLLLLDEVTAALDPELVKEVLDTIRSLAGSGMTMLIVSHEMTFVRDVADRVVMLDHGRIVENGSPESFFASPATERARSFLRLIARD